MSSIKQTILVALGVCFVASIFVSTAAVKLKPIQVKNKKMDLLKNILVAGDLYKEGEDVNKIYKENVQPEIVDLKSGNILKKDKFDAVMNPNDFDIRCAVNDAKWSEKIPADKDIAGIKIMPTAMAVYQVLDKNKNVIKYILPIYGKGLWSTMYGFIALDKDLHTIKGFTFYDQGETPGLGGEVDNPKWKKLWIGKQAFDKSGKLKIEVIKRIVDPDDPDAKYKIDGLSGATLTTRGVNHLVRFWLSDDGYGHFIKNLRGDKNEQI